VTHNAGYQQLPRTTGRHPCVWKPAENKKRSSKLGTGGGSRIAPFSKTTNAPWTAGQHTVRGGADVVCTHTLTVLALGAWMRGCRSAYFLPFNCAPCCSRASDQRAACSSIMLSQVLRRLDRLRFPCRIIHSIGVVVPHRNLPERRPRTEHRCKGQSGWSCSLTPGRMSIAVLLQPLLIRQDTGDFNHIAMRLL
jgi:hypothetical protein